MTAAPEMPQGWTFLVARGRRHGYTTVLAPDFLVAEGRGELLSEAIGGAGMAPGARRVVELADPDIGSATVSYTVERLTNADLDGPEADDALLTDEHGRPLEILYGILTRERLSGPAGDADLVRARDEALRSYRRFLAAEDTFVVERSAAAPLDAPRAAAQRSTIPPPVTESLPEITPQRSKQPPTRHGTRGGFAPAKYKVAIWIGAVLVLLGVAWALTSSGNDLTVYASLPLQGSERRRSLDIDRAMRLALRQAANKAGGFNVKYRLLDDSSADARGWTPEAVASNANRAADDDSTAVYIGEVNSGATAISVLILSGKRIAQISPASTAVGLTSAGPGADSGEPRNHYQDGFRNFVRVVPKDTVQGDALVAIMRADGCAHVGMINDREDYGAGLARNVRNAAEARDVQIVFDEPIDRGAPDYRSGAARAARKLVDCFLFSGDTRSDAVEVYKAMAATLPAGARFYGGDGVAGESFTDASQGGVPTQISKRMSLTIPALGPPGYGTAGRRFFTDFGNAYPDRLNPDPYAINAYESMKLALDAIKRSGTGTREDIVKALFATKRRRSVLGTYSIDHNGDTTLTDYGRFDIRDGKARFVRRIETARQSRSGSWQGKG
jgi:branched-chain amino acid transport system substrate-binding protein